MTYWWLNNIDELHKGLGVTTTGLSVKVLIHGHGTSQGLTKATGLAWNEIRVNFQYTFHKYTLLLFEVFAI